MGGFHYVDKVICGNGFSTAFINAKPPRNKINIIIAPNRAVVEGKEADYRLNGNRSGNIVKFFYKNSIDTDLDANVLMFVADSFLLLKEKIKFIQDKINWVLIDEAHSVEIQSSFRPKLVNFFDKVRDLIGDEPALTCVTATPNLFTKPTIIIKNEVVKGFTIKLTKDKEEAVKRIKKLLKKKERVIVATNDKKVIYSLRNYKNELEADFTLGDNLKAKLPELMLLKQNSESNLKIISSRGFEGFDIHGEGYNVFFFENRNSNYDNFYASNLYQAFSRARDGVKYAEYCLLERTSKRLNLFKDIDIEVDAFINRSDISVEKKQGKGKNDEFKKFKPFVEFREDDEGKFSIHRNTSAINLYKEGLVYDYPFPAPEFREFFEDRKVKIVDEREDVQNDLKHIKLRFDEREKRLKANELFILKNDLFGDDYLFTRHYDKNDCRERFLKDFNTYIRRKNYKGTYILTERESITKELVSSEKAFHKLISKVTKSYRERATKKHGVNESRRKIKEFKEQAEKVVLKVIEAFTRKNIYFYEKMTASRDYNTLTEIGMTEINIIAEHYNIVALEVDIKNCFSRIIYALNGLRLPEDFYGVNKVNKDAINVFLNNFFYNKSNKSPKKKQKSRSKLKFLDLGFKKEVVDFLIDNFFESKYRGDCFNFLARYERKLIKELKALIPEGTHEGVVRRHDSLIIFNPTISMAHLNNVGFLGIFGDWVEIDENHKLKIN